MADGQQTITLGQVTGGVGGNTTITDDITQTTIVGFTGGADSEVLSSISDPRKYHGKPVYVGSTFQGYLRQAVLQPDNSVIRIYLDRPWDGTSSGVINVLEYTNGLGTSTYSESSKLTQELNF